MDRQKKFYIFGGLQQEAFVNFFQQQAYRHEELICPYWERWKNKINIKIFCSVQEHFSHFSTFFCEHWTSYITLTKKADVSIPQNDGDYATAARDDATDRTQVTLYYLQLSQLIAFSYAGDALISENSCV